MDILEKIKNADSVADLIMDIAKELIEDMPSKASIPNFPEGDVVVTNLAYLHPKVLNQVLSALKACQDSGNNLTIVETFRTTQRQSALYEQGRSVSGDIVTNAKEGESYHNYGLAIDVSPVNDAVGEIFEKFGFEWGARWKSIKDYPHFQMTFGLQISQLKALYAEGGVEKVWQHIFENC